MSYSKIAKDFSSVHCQLITSEKEYLKQRETLAPSYCKLTFIASCGHLNTVTYTSFSLYKIGILCKACSRQELSKQSKDRSSLVVGENTETQMIEDRGYQAVVQQIQDEFIVKKTAEGCLADFIVRPKHEVSDQFLKVQLKVTEKQNRNSYGFGLNQKYTDCLMLCYCIEEGKCWLFPFDDIQHLKSKIHISSVKSKYDRFEVKNTHLSQKVFEYFRLITLFSEDICMLPISQSQQQEQSYKSLRLQRFDFLE